MRLFNTALAAALLVAGATPSFGMTLGELTVRNVKLRPSAPAIIFEERTITHAEFGARAFCLANALIAMGVRGGDRVAISAQLSGVGAAASAMENGTRPD